MMLGFKTLTTCALLFALIVCSCAKKELSAEALAAMAAEKAAKKEAEEKQLLQKLSPPGLVREMRGAWIATVANIDWPPKPGMPAEEQRAALINIFNRAVSLKLNVIFLQVRSQCDAVYSSSIEPWSSPVTGTMGQPPEPLYDPLEFAIAEAHKRGIELHAWFNPFRALIKSKSSTPSRNHISNTHPDWVRDYGKHLWLDPGEPGARDYSLSVVLDVVRRYDIDGVQFDDYFYPYAEKDDNKKLIPFPDDVPYKKYTDAGGTLGRSDWRRENVNQFVQAIYTAVKKEKPWVKFGIAPFGIWKARTNKELNAYEELACDSRKWLVEGWVDYMAPQLYWRTEDPERPYVDLLKWWVEQNTLKRHLWPGHFTSEIGDVDTKTKKIKMTAEDILGQVRLTRQQPTATGDIQYSMKALMANRGEIADRLAKEIYTNTAVVPSFSWLGASVPAKPKLTGTKLKSEMEVNWQPVGEEKIAIWVLQKRTSGKWETELLPGDQTSLALKAADGKLPEAFVLTAIDRVGKASPPVPFAFKK